MWRTIVLWEAGRSKPLEFAPEAVEKLIKEE